MLTQSCLQWCATAWSPPAGCCLADSVRIEAQSAPKELRAESSVVGLASCSSFALLPQWFPDAAGAASRPVGQAHGLPAAHSGLDWRLAAPPGCPVVQFDSMLPCRAFKKLHAGVPHAGNGALCAELSKPPPCGLQQSGGQVLANSRAERALQGPSGCYAQLR